MPFLLLFQDFHGIQQYHIPITHELNIWSLLRHKSLTENIAYSFATRPPAQMPHRRLTNSNLFFIRSVNETDSAPLDTNTLNR
jgi:hypothetical protein